jgi:tetratricopeptide (TPR) repeat protein
VGLFKVYDPNEGLVSKITAQEILDKGAARIEKELADQPATQATLMETMGTAYTNLGLYPAAIPLMRKSLQKRRSLPGDTTAALAQSLGHLGEALMMNGDNDEAAKRLEDALAIQRRLLGNSSPDVANTLSALADVMSVTGAYEKGQAMIEEALRIRRKLYGEVHPDVAKSLADLGVNFGERGDYKQAEIYLRQALDLQRKLHRPCTRTFPKPSAISPGHTSGSANSRRPNRSIVRPWKTTGSFWAMNIRKLRSVSTTWLTSSRRAATFAAPRRLIANRSRSAASDSPPSTPRLRPA